MTSVSLPEAIVQRPHSLLLRWPDGDMAIDAVDLRAACRCADCRAATLQGHPWPGDTAIRLAGITPVGSYALQLTFSDGHDRGIYPWALLRELSTRAGAAEVTPADRGSLHRAPAR